MKPVKRLKKDRKAACSLSITSSSTSVSSPCSKKEASRLLAVCSVSTPSATLN